METCPWELAMVQGGPGEVHPGGVLPAVSQRFASPTGEVIPGLKTLFVRDPEPVMLFVKSVILMIQGVEQDTLGFQEPEPTGNWGEPTILALDPLVCIVDSRRIPVRTGRMIQKRLRQIIVRHYPKWRGGRQIHLV